MTATARTSCNICDAIEDDIVTGKQPPGTKLDEASLCERFEVSRTPIREALRFLSEGCNPVPRTSLLAMTPGFLLQSEVSA